MPNERTALVEDQSPCRDTLPRPLQSRVMTRTLPDPRTRASVMTC